MGHHVIQTLHPTPYPMVAPKHLPEPQTTKMKRANNQGPTDAFSSGAFLCKNENSLFKCKTPLRPRAPAAYTSGQVTRSSHLTGFPSVPEPPSSSTHVPEPPPPVCPRQLKESSSWPRSPSLGENSTRPYDPGLSPGCWTEGRLLFPYRGLGDVAALGDVLAVLLVGHTDSLLGDHLPGATTCPATPWTRSLASPWAAATLCSRSLCRRS